MAANDEIKAWLNSSSPSYEEGLNLFESYCRKPAMAEQLRRFPDATMLRKLLQQLHKPEPKGTKAKTKPTVSVEYKNDSPELKNDRIAIAKRIDSIKSTLFSIGRNPLTDKPLELSATKKQQRLALAKLLVGNEGLHERFINNLVAARHFREYGTLPEKEEEVQISVSGDIYLMKENCRKQCSRLATKIEQAKEEMEGKDRSTKAALKLKIAKWENQLAEGRKKLKALEKKVKHG